MIFRNKFFSLLTVFSLFCLTLSATTNVKYSIQTVGNSSFVLNLDEVIQANIQIRIKDDNGQEIFEETLLQNEISNRRYDLSELPAGAYFLILDYDNVINIQPITKTFDKLTTDLAAVQTILKPNFRQSPGFVDVNYLPAPESAMQLYIKDAEGRTIYEETDRQAKPLHKRYNLLELAAGNYSLKLRVTLGRTTFVFEETIDLTPSLVANN